MCEPELPAGLGGRRAAGRGRRVDRLVRGALHARPAPDPGRHPHGRRGREPRVRPARARRAGAAVRAARNAELRALRAQISPHFIYNALAAIAGYIRTQPEEARELLTEFAEFTRYAFRGQRPYVTLADELHYVEKYLRLERARFGDRLHVRAAGGAGGAAGGRTGPVGSAAGRERRQTWRRAPGPGQDRDLRARHGRRRRTAGVRNGVGMEPRLAAVILAGHGRRRRDRQRAGAPADRVRTRVTGWRSTPPSGGVQP